MLVILITWESEIRRIAVPGQPRQKSLWALIFIKESREQT
jgi:hypothetical protein